MNGIIKTLRILLASFELKWLFAKQCDSQQYKHDTQNVKQFLPCFVVNQQEKTVVCVIVITNERFNPFTYYSKSKNYSLCLMYWSALMATWQQNLFFFICLKISPSYKHTHTISSSQNNLIMTLGFSVS